MSIFLNHFYIVLEPAAYRDILQNEFLRSQFAPNEVRTTVRRDMTYSGLYFYGTHTYFEFFDASNPLLAGQFPCDGLALGVDRSGALAEVEKKLADLCTCTREQITRQYGGGQVPWFTLMKARDFIQEPTLTLWFMEYQARFLQEWNPQAAGPNEGVRRKDLLQRYVAVLKERPPRPFLKDVTSLTLATDEAAREKISRLVRLAGLGKEVEIKVVPPAGEKPGIREFSMRLRRIPRGMTELRFGEKSRLRFHDGKSATWSFH